MVDYKYIKNKILMYLPICLGLVTIGLFMFSIPLDYTFFKLSIIIFGMSIFGYIVGGKIKGGKLKC